MADQNVVTTKAVEVDSTGIEVDNSGPAADADAELAAEMDSSSSAPKKSAKVHDYSTAQSERDELMAVFSKAKAEAEGKAEEDAPKANAIKSALAKLEKQTPAAEDKPAPAAAETAQTKLHRDLAERGQQRQKVAEAEQLQVKAREAWAAAEAAVREAKAMSEEIRVEKERLKKLWTEPAAVINEVGWNQDEFLKAADRAKDPNYQAQQSLVDKFEKRFQTLEEENKRLSALAQSYETQGAKVTQQQKVKAFFELFPQDSPARKLYSDDQLIAWADNVSAQSHAKTRRYPPYKDVVAYIDAEARSKLQGLLPQESEGKKAAAKSKANGSRALTQRDATEHRGSSAPKEYEQMTAEEQKAFLTRVFEDAKKAAG